MPARLGAVSRSATRRRRRRESPRSCSSRIGRAPRRRIRSGRRMAGGGGYNVSQVNKSPRAVSDPPLCAPFERPDRGVAGAAARSPIALLIRRNRRALETLEEKYLTRSSSALADRVSAYYASASAQLCERGRGAAAGGPLTGRDPFTSDGGAAHARRVLRAARSRCWRCAASTRTGAGSFAGPDVAIAAGGRGVSARFRAARRGERYSGQAVLGARRLGPVAVLAVPVDGRRTAPRRRRGARVLGSRSCRSSSARRGGKCARRSWTARERILFPFSPGEQMRKHPSTLVADFTRFPARVTRSEDDAATAPCSRRSRPSASRTGACCSSVTSISRSRRST